MTSESDSSDENISLLVFRCIHQKNERLAKALSCGKNLSVLFSSDDSESDTVEFDVDQRESPAVGASGSGSYMDSQPSDMSESDNDTDHHIDNNSVHVSDFSSDPDQSVPDRSRPRQRGRPKGRRRTPPSPLRVWMGNLTYNVPKRFTGAENGPSADFSDRSVSETFQLMFTDDFLVETVRLTKLNYQRKYQQSPGKNKTSFPPLTVDELKTWLGVIVGMGLVQLKGDIRSYWSKKHRLTRTDGFPEVFPCTCFLQILRYIHFADEDHAVHDRNNDKFYKIRFLFDYLIPKFRELYNPAQNISVDERMIKGQGRMPARQFMCNKPSHWCLKVWALCESKTGYYLNGELYSGKTGDDGEKDKTAAVVKTLVSPYCGKGHVVFMDNLYTSVPLLDDLYYRGFMAVGTVRENRKKLPCDSVGKKKTEVRQLQLGEAFWRQSDKIYFVTWRDTKVVYVMSTLPVTKECSTVQRTVKRCGQWEKIDIPRPNIIGTYNINTGGVDLADKKIVCYKRQTKGLKWYHRVLWYMLDVSILNAYIIYRTSHADQEVLTLREFRQEFSTQLIEGRSYRKAVQVVVGEDDLRKYRLLDHAPQKMQTSVNCRVHLQRVETAYICRVCGIRMCLAPCFHHYHYMDSYMFDDPTRQTKEKIRRKLHIQHI